MPVIRTMIPGDLPSARRFSSQNGWNQTEADWLRFLEMEPDGCFVADLEGQPAGTVTTLSYQKRLAWIGMMLVDSKLRRMGIGEALLRKALQRLEESGVDCVKLDATPLGQPLYEKLGFQPEWPLTRWRCEIAVSPPNQEDPDVRPWNKRDALKVAGIDDPAFGINRSGLLEALGSISTGWVRSGMEGIRGFGLIRPGAFATYLGPVTADDIRVADGIVRRLLSGQTGQPVIWDIPDANTDAVRLAEELGFKPQRSLLRMFRGTNSMAGDPFKQFAIAGPEVG